MEVDNKDINKHHQAITRPVPEIIVLSLYLGKLETRFVQAIFGF